MRFAATPSTTPDDARGAANKNACKVPKPSPGSPSRSSCLSCAGGSPVRRDVTKLCRVGKAEPPIRRAQFVVTRRIYLHADMQLKERALAHANPSGLIPDRFRPADPLLTFLESL